MTKKKLIIGIIVLISAVLVGGVLWFWQNNSGQEKAREIRRKPELTDQDRAKMQVEIDKLHENPLDISNWKTYRNEKYGFEVRYPEDWAYSERFYKGGRGVFVFSIPECLKENSGDSRKCNDVFIIPYNNINEKDEFWKVDEFEYGGKIPVLAFSKKNVNNIVAYRDNLFEYVRDVYKLAKGNSGCKLIIKYKDIDYNPIIERTILESFKFIDKKN